MKSAISEVEIIPIKPKGGLVALASVVYDNGLYLGSIGVHTKLDGSGYRLTYPTKVVKGRSLNIFHPINRDMAAAIELAIFRQLDDVMNQQGNARHRGTDTA